MRVVFDPEHRSFAETDDRRRVFFVKFEEPLLARFAFVRGVWIGIEKVAVELITGQRAAGKVAWTRRKTLGIRFDDSVDVIALLNRKLVSQAPERRGAAGIASCRT